MTTKERLKIYNDSDYISSKRYNNSLKKFIEAHDKMHGTDIDGKKIILTGVYRGVPDSMIASLLKITTEEVARHYTKAILTLRKFTGNQ